VPQFNEVDHSAKLASDFSTFLFDETLADIRIEVKKSQSIFMDNNFTAGSPDPFKQCNNIIKEDSELSSCDLTNKTTDFVILAAHKIVLASRCQYFFSKFTHQWADNNSEVARFHEFSETPMRAFLRYLYTGKLKIELKTVMGVMKISSYFNNEDLVRSCKNFLTGQHLNAFDLCLLYCEVRDENHDFDDMRAFLTQLIPDKIDNSILCRVLRNIWVTPQPK
jgi:hypothetical protein